MSITTSISDAGTLLYIQGASAQSLFLATADAHKARVSCRTAPGSTTLKFKTDDASYELYRIGDDYTLTIRLLDTK